MINGLSPLSDHNIPECTGELRLFSVVRNESQRLPFVLQYYKDKGVERFFFVDNGSTDGTVEMLLADSCVHVFQASERYSESRYGTNWLGALLACYGEKHWCVVADADELLVYPDSEHLSLPQLCNYLDSESASALRCLLVDMYSDKPFEDTKYVPGTNPLHLCPFFETDSIMCMGSLPRVKVDDWMHGGGMRLRLFDVRVRLDKVSLIKYNTAVKLQPGMHGIEGVRASKVRGAVLHFKYFSDFTARVNCEAGRGEHWDNAVEYKRYAEVTAARQQLSAYCEISRRFCSSADLVDCGVMRRPADFAEYCSVLTQVQAI